MKKSNYFKLELKRFFKHYPSILVIVLLTIAAVGISMVVALSSNFDGEKTAKIKVGIVGSAEDNIIGLAVDALQSMDSTRFSVDFIELDEDAAQKALKNREISGYIDIPENFVHDVYYGRNTSATYVTLDGPSSLGPVLINEITDVIKNILGEAQKATKGVLSVSNRYKIKNKWDKVEQLDISYVKLLLMRNDLYDVSETGTTDSVSFAGYYICSAVMLMLLLWGIACNGLFIKKNLAMSRVLSVRGINASSQTLYRYLCFFILTFVTCMLFAVIFGAVASTINIPIRELKNISVITAAMYMFKIIPVIVMITLMQFFIYEVADGIVDMIVIQFIVALGMAYISGCFYPNYFFPEIVQKVSAYLPAGVGLSYMRKTMVYDSAFSEFAMICGYSVLFGALAVIIRKKRMAGDVQ